jgi:PAS domain S-box-containing protein
MDRLWLSAPAPALHVRSVDGGLLVEPNDHALKWAARESLEHPDWPALAAEALASAADRPLRDSSALGVPVGWRRVALEDGSTLLWLDFGADAILERSRVLAEAIGVGFWTRDIDAGVAYWDRQMYRVLRRRPEDGPPAFGDWIEQYVHPEDRPWINDVHRRANAAWEPVVDAVFRTLDDADGSPRWIQTWTRRVVREDGHRVAFGMHLDVSERQRAAADVERERRRMQLAVEAAELGVWERALDGTITYWNEMMYRLRGLDPKDPRPPDQVAQATTHPDDHALLLDAVRRHVDEGLPYRFEFRVRLPDGGWRWIGTHGRALRDGRGRVVGFAGINIDINERKAAETLRLQIARTEEASREKSAFLARLSHELRTPMNAVLGFAQLLESDKQEPPSARQRGRLRRIADAGAEMMALVDDLLDLAGLDGAPAPPAPMEAADAVREVLQLLAERAAVRGVTLRSAIADPACRIVADKRRLVQVLEHLAADALRRQRSGGTVEIGVVQDGAQATLFVRDDAPPDSGESSGGLAIAERLVRALGATLEAGPVRGGGIELRLRLAAATVKAPRSEAPPLVVLCVEDNPVNLLLVREVLALRPQVTLHEAVDGTTGIAAALQHRPQVLLLDLQLPDMSGLDVMRRLRTEAALADSVFVALSANAMPDQIAAARAAGFDDYWTKPIDFAHFLAAIDRLARECQAAKR